MKNLNKNEVVLTWKRTSSEYYDTLIDDCHIFTFGVDLTKLFSDLDSESATEMDMFKHVKFRIRNTIDGYWLTANRDEETGIYYVTGHVTEEADGTVFYPVTVGGEFGKIVIKGVEDDSYEIFEIETANGYTLLKDEIVVDIFVEENYDRICDIYTKDVLGVLQNDPHWKVSKRMRLTTMPSCGHPRTTSTSSTSPATASWAMWRSPTFR